MTPPAGVGSIDDPKGGLSKVNPDDRQQRGDPKELGDVELIENTDAGPVLHGEGEQQAGHRQGGAHDHKAEDDVSQYDSDEVSRGPPLVGELHHGRTQAPHAGGLVDSAIRFQVDDEPKRREPL